jgi:site-specific recombinase XerD
MNGADVKLVKDWLGHAELENTLAYTDLAPGHWTEFSQEALRRFRF